MKANDLGKLGIAKRTSAAARTSTGSHDESARAAGPSKKRLQTDPEDKPWEARLQKGKAKRNVKLIELSDDD
jgi:hypothetical protein